MSRWLIIIAIVLLAAGGVGAYLSLTAAAPVQAARVATGEIREYVDERGKTRLLETHLIAMPFAGRVEAIDLPAGRRVARDEIVARIVSQDLEDAVAEAGAAVERLAAAIAENDDTTVETTTQRQAELLAESMISTVAAAEAKLTADKSRAEYAETFLGRVQRLITTGSQTEDDLDRAKLANVESQVAYRQDALTVETLKTIKAATELLPRIVGQYIDRKSLTRRVLEKEKLEAEARLRQALLRRERGVMRSPVDGVVLERLIVNEQHLPAGTALLRIGQLDRLEVEADVLSEDVVRIREGFAAEIYGPAIGADVGSGAEGVVRRVYPHGFTKISSLGVEQQRVRVLVAFAPGQLEQLRQSRQLGVDFRVRVRIYTDQRSDALLVPRSAVFRMGDRGWAVFAAGQGRARIQPIEAGLMNDDAVQVVEGLAAGDTVVLAPDASLADGQRVKPIFRE